MRDPDETILHRLWFTFVAILITVCLLLLSFRVAVTGVATDSHGDTLTRLATSLNTSTAGVVKAAHSLRQAADGAGNTLDNIGKSIGLASVRSMRTIGHAINTGFVSAVIFASSSVLFVMQFPGTVVGSAANMTIVRAVIRPADRTLIPTIDPHPPAVLAATTTLPQAITVSHTTPVAAPTAPVAAAIWPIHGAITTQFGASDLPYERVHTGIDISDGHAAGITPVVPYRSGQVVEVIYGYTGLGNHVVVDHGSGITSVYGHLASIAVRVGQAVDATTPLGREGSTGASTGTHLHFEIRVNGVPVNPELYINGLP